MTESTAVQERDAAEATLATGLKPLRAAGVSSTGQQVVAYGTVPEDDDYLQVWDVGSQAETHRFPALGTPLVVRFTPSESALLVAEITGGEVALVRRIALDGISPDQAIITQSGVTGLGVSGDSRTVALYGPGAGITVLDTQTREQTELDTRYEMVIQLPVVIAGSAVPEPRALSVEKVALSARGEVLAVSIAGQIRVYELNRAPGRPLSSRLTGVHEFSDVAGLACSGRFVIAASGRVVRLVHGEARERDLYTAPEPIGYAEPEPIGRIAISASGTMVAVAHGDTLALVGISTGKVIQTWTTAGPVVQLSFRLDDKALVTGHGDGTVRLWDTASHAVDEGLRLQPDAAAHEDALEQEPLARLLAARLRRFQVENADASFLVHVDGPWGSGKSTLLSLLRQHLTTAGPGDSMWLVVDFNAWRESKVGIAWWALLAALRRALADDRKKWLGRAWLRVSEAGARARWAGAPFILAFLVLLVLAAVFFGVLRPSRLTLASSEGIAQGITTLVAALGTLWAGSRLAGRFFLWDSARGARAYEQSSANPMDDVARHFEWLIKKAGKPVVFFIDDLDRCSNDYVVALLDAVETLIRDAGSDRSPASGTAPCFVVAADGTWIRRSYEIAYSQFTESMAQAGQELGYLFLDKLFQLRVPMPGVGAGKRGQFVQQLLRPSGPEATAEAGRLSSASATTATEHWLQQFAVLFPPNPRAIKRFINNFSILREVRTLEGNPIAMETLALWTIIETRWPALAGYLRTHPEAISLVSRPSDNSQQQRLADVPDHLRPLFTDPDLRRLVYFHLGGPLTPALITQCCGLTPAWPR